MMMIMTDPDIQTYYYWITLCTAEFILVFLLSEIFWPFCLQNILYLQPSHCNHNYVRDEQTDRQTDRQTYWRTSLEQCLLSSWNRLRNQITVYRFRQTVHARVPCWKACICVSCFAFPSHPNQPTSSWPTSHGTFSFSYAIAQIMRYYYQIIFCWWITWQAYWAFNYTFHYNTSDQSLSGESVFELHMSTFD